MFFICKYCRGIFSSIALLKAHKSLVHKESGTKEIVTPTLGHLTPEIEFERCQLDPNGNSGIWYQCPACRSFLQDSTQFIMHLEDCLEPQRPGLFHMSDGEIMAIGELELEVPQIFIPKITLSPLTDTLQMFGKLVPPKCSVNVSALTDAELESIKADMAKRKLRPRSTLKKSWRIEDVITDSEDAGDMDTSRVGGRIRMHRVKPSGDNRWKGRNNKTNATTKPSVAKSPYPCDVCGKDMKYLSRYRNHIASHKRTEETNKSKPFHCSICNIGFVRKENLVRHTVKHIDNNPFKCRVCGLKTISKNHLRRHLALHFDESKVTCEICGKQVVRLESLRRHLQTAHSGTATAAAPVKWRSKRNSYRICKTYLQRIPLHASPPLPPSPSDIQLAKDAIRVHESGKIMVKEKGDLEEQIAATAETTPIPNRYSPIATGAREASNQADSINGQWKTEIITKMTQLYPELGYRSTHTTGGNRDSFVCTYCPDGTAAFSRSFALRFHVKTFHPQEFLKENETEDLRMICGVCGFATTSTEEFSSHTTTAHQTLVQKKFHCSLCGLRLKSQLRLDRHVDQFHTSRPSPEYECPMCKKKYATVTQLRHHQKLVCNLENKPTGVKFICQHCGKEAPHKIALARHLRLHSTHRTLSICKLCNERCSNNSSLRRHIHLIHGNGIYRRNKGSERKPTPVEPVPEDQLFL